MTKPTDGLQEEPLSVAQINEIAIRMVGELNEAVAKGLISLRINEQGDIEVTTLPPK